MLLEELSDIFRRLGLSMIEGGLISLTAVKVTPDLLEARVYLSLFQVKDTAAVMKIVEDRAWEIKRELAGRVKVETKRNRGSAVVWILVLHLEWLTILLP